MRVLISGGLGFIGSHIARRLTAAGHEVYVADNMVRRGVEQNLAELGERFVWCDFRQAEDVAALPAADLFINCHAEMVATGAHGYERPDFPVRNNGFSTLHVLEYCRRHQARLVHISTNRVYNLEPLEQYRCVERDTRLELEGFEGICAARFGTDGGEKGIYGVSKLVADALVREWVAAFGLRAVINRIGSITGPGQFGCAEQGWASHFVRCWAERRPLAFIGHGGKQVRDLLHVSDLCRFIEMQLEQSAFDGEVCDIGGGKAGAISLLEAAALLEKRFGWTVPIEHRPTKKADPAVTFMDNTAVEQRYGWKPRVGLESIFTEMADLTAAAGPSESAAV
jgi:CDP-paratose 2-epimerase